MDRRTRTLWTYYLFRATTSYGFYLPFSTIYLVQQGYGLDVIGLAQSAFLFAMVAAEIPAGYVADRIDRRTTLAAGNAISAASLGAYPFVGSATGWIVVYGLWGLGAACHSAIGEAWLYDLLAQRTAESSFARTSGRGATVELVVSAASAMAASLLYAVDPAFPFLANAALSAAGVPLLFTLPATRNGADSVISIAETLRALKLQLHRSEVRWLVAYAALFNVLFSVTRWLEQPALDAVGIPITSFGLLYAGFKLVTAGATSTTGLLQERLGARGFFLLLLPVCGVAYAMVYFLPLFVVPVLLLRRALDRVSRPIRNQYLNDRLDSVGRATILSGVSMALHLASGAGNAVFGLVAEATGPMAFLPVAGVGVVLVAGVLWVATDPVREPSGGVGPSESPSPGEPTSKSPGESMAESTAADSDAAGTD